MPHVLTKLHSRSQGVLDAWKARCDSLTAEERRLFESVANGCSGLDQYVKKLETACQKHRDESTLFKIFDWLDPFLTAVNIFMPIPQAMVQSYPNPGALVLGGIVAVVDATNRFRDYQKLTLQMLSQMSSKATLSLQYEAEVYQGEAAVQAALVDVYGDIIDFCLKAVRVLSTMGDIQAKVKGLALAIFRKYESHLGAEVARFERDVDILESKANLVDKLRIKQILENQQDFNQKLGSAMGEHFRREQEYRDLRETMWKKKEEIDKRKYYLTMKSEQVLR